MAGKQNYRVVEIPMLVSPCRNCKETICSRSRCALVAAFNKRCDDEVITSYGIVDYGELADCAQGADDDEPVSGGHQVEEIEELDALAI